MDFVPYLHHAFDRMLAVCEVVVVFMAVELVIPTRQVFPVLARLKGLTFLLLQSVVFALAVDPLYILWTHLGVKPIYIVPLDAMFHWAGPLGAAVIGAIAAAFIADFFGYWFHRVQHGPLWRFHAVHHSIENLHGVSSYTHILDPMFQLVLMSIPMSFFPVTRGAEPYLIGALIVMQPYYIHSPMRPNFGPLRYVFTDNRFHRIHHSTQPEHFDKNFGVITTFWDQLFGTAYFPKPGEWPATGIAEAREPRGLVEWLLFPLRYGGRDEAPKTTQTAGEPVA